MSISLTSENTEMLIASDISPLALFIPQPDVDAGHGLEMVSYLAWDLLGGYRHHPAPRYRSFGCDNPGVSGNRCPSSHRAVERAWDGNRDAYLRRS